MSSIDWGVLVLSLTLIIGYGIYAGRRSQSLDQYLLSGRDMRWHIVAFSIMATQASAITFLSTPGQAFTDGMRFVQFYFGLPLAMIVLSITAVPIYHKLRVFTAYEYLETRFDSKTRILAAGLFLLQRGLACGLTIYAPALVVSVLLGWNLYLTNFMIGALVIVYTAYGGTRAVGHTHLWQMLIVLATLTITGFLVVSYLPQNVSFGDALFVAGKLGRLNAVDFSFNLTDKYNIWSGLIGGFFLALSYFGTDQSQVARYLGGQSIAASRIALLFNGLVKVPMQFGILLIGVMVFVFYQFEAPPIFFNSVEADRVAVSARADDFHQLEREYGLATSEKSTHIKRMLQSRDSGDVIGVEGALQRALAADEKAIVVRDQAIDLMVEGNPRMDRSDTNYVFLNFILHHLPAGLIGLVMASIFAGSMSSTSSELNALASTTAVDVYKRAIRRNASDRHYLVFSKGATVVWGIIAIVFAEYASKLGSLVEAVNVLGSLFYGTVLGIFLLAFYFKRIGGTAAFVGAIAGEVIVIACFIWSDLSFLWYNVVGCLAVILIASILQLFSGKREPRPL